MDRVQLQTIARECATPAYLFDIDELISRIKMVKQELAQPIQLCYAMKANPFLIKPIQTCVDKYEVCSMGEFRICERAGIAMEQIVLSGVNKEKEDILSIMETYGSKGTYTIESLEQLELLEYCAAQTGNVIRALVRLTSGNQFGVDEEDICTMIEKRKAYPHISFVGLQYYSGTQKKKMEKIEKELRYLDTFLQRLKEESGYEAEELEYGPGLYVPYFQTDEETDDGELLQGLRNLLSELKYTGKITLEMGRYLSAYCGYYLTSIADQKNNHGQQYAIVDGGINHLTYYGQAMAMKTPYYQHVHKNVQKNEGDVTEENWNICGSLCTVNDVIVKQLPLKDVAVGDIIIFERTGAYAVTEGIYLFLSRDLPQILFYSKENGIQMIRERKQTDIMNGMAEK